MKAIRGALSKGTPNAACRSSNPVHSAGPSVSMSAEATKWSLFVNSKRSPCLPLQSSSLPFQLSSISHLSRPAIPLSSAYPQIRRINSASELSSSETPSPAVPSQQSNGFPDPKNPSIQYPNSVLSGMIARKAVASPSSPPEPHNKHMEESDPTATTFAFLEAFSESDSFSSSPSSSPLPPSSSKAADSFLALLKPKSKGSSSADVPQEQSSSRKKSPSSQSEKRSSGPSSAMISKRIDAEHKLRQAAHQTVQSGPSALDDALDFDELIAAAERPEDKLYFEQLKLENRVLKEAIESYQDTCEEVARSGHFTCMRPAHPLIRSWFEPLVTKIEEEKIACQNNVRGEDRDLYSPYLQKLDSQQIAVILLHDVLGSAMTSKPVEEMELTPGKTTARIALKADEDTKTLGYKFVTAALQVGNSLEAEYNLQVMRKNMKNAYHALKSSGRAITVTEVNKFCRRSLNHDELPEWKKDVKAKLGSRLLQILLESAYIKDQNGNLVPAFYRKLREHGVKTIGFIEVADIVRQQIDTGHAEAARLHPKVLPMLSRPKPWKAHNRGGYYTIQNPLMRKTGSQTQIKRLQEADKAGNLESVYKALNGLGSVRWSINRRVHDVMEEAWSLGGQLGDMPSKTSLSVPLPPAGLDLTQYRDPAVAAYNKQVRRIEHENRNMHSLRCDFMLKLNVAREFRGRDFFYFPYNLDFRGRAYPLPPHLNHLGSDLCRGLLKFSDERPLGTHGLKWLKIHLANLCGADKLGLTDRLKFVEEHIPLIMDSADNPLEGQRWWLKAEDPWQALAACMELTDAIRSGNPEEFMSSLPCHQDGSCNGLQHYAALGRDAWGGEQVNLTYSEKPQDVYMGVCNLVTKQIAIDAANNDRLAQLLMGHVERKTIKQTVMTSVYGVTLIGAREQIANRLREKKSVPDEDIYPCSMYLAKLTLKSLGDIFKGARDIMDWLATCARKIASIGYPVSWETPMGLPVVQPYRRVSKNVVTTIMQDMTLVDSSDKLPVSLKKQASAFPPNFVHSLDSTHMLLTALECQKARITFAAVHDSFWTHAAHVDDMNKILREQFIHLHSQPVLEKLSKSFQDQFPVEEFPPLPERGTLDLTQVMKSDYFFD